MGPVTSLHEIAVDILGVAGRPCRPFQERIEEYAMDGRPRFEWEAMRHRLLLQGDPAILAVCGGCPLNIFQGAEGCKGTVENLEVFFRVLARLYPESPWTRLPLDADPIPPEATRELYRDLSRIEEVFAASPWKVAQVFRWGQPLLEHLPDESVRPRFYPWNGEAPPALITGNEGYQVFLCPHGLVVKAVFEDPVPHVFHRLWRDDQGVFGLSGQGETVGFQMNMARYPEWDPEEPRAHGELQVVDLPAADVFRDTLDVLAVFAGVAVEGDTGLLLHPV